LGTSLGYTRIIPVQVGSDTDWEAAWVRGGTSFAQKDDGTLLGWGDNRYSQVDSSGFDTSVPTVIGSFPDLDYLAPGYEHILAIRSGALWAWGRNDYGQCGTDSAVSTVDAPAQMGTWSDWESVAGSDRFSIGIRTDGSLWAWGYNNYGQLGTDTALTEIDTPARIGTATDWSQVGTGYYSSYAIRDDGTLWAWGRNDYRQLGDELLPSPSPIPSQIGTGTNWRFVTGGQLHAQGIRTDDSLWGWGYNSYGNLGLGPGYPVPVSPPVRVGTDTDWAYVGAGQHYSIGTRSDGTLYGWGTNLHGQVPDGTSCVETPQQVY
jgi:alpha-tubulin suppressor-like RCC1 family protein